MKAGFELQGDLVERMLKAFELELPQKIRAVVSNTADDTLSAVKVNTPRGQTGKLLAGWKRTPIRVKKYGGSVTVRNNAKYAKAIEGGSSSQAPDGVLNPVLNPKIRDTFNRRIKSTLQGVLDSL